jgi:ParB/RepB/Spo0J family partition protein
MMSKKPEEQAGVIDLETDQIRERYQPLRLIHPRAELKMLDSMRRYGQLTPVVVGRDADGGYEMVDGFKRLRASRQLERSVLKAAVLEAGSRALKAAIVELNRTGGSLGPLEEALIVRSLYREDMMQQSEIGLLLGRHKSWVCRRISVVEGLSEEVLEHLRLGLIGLTTGRELGRLPRGNQSAALATVLKYTMTTRETHDMVTLLKERPRWEHEAILRFPEPILSRRCPPRPRAQKPAGPHVHVEKVLGQIHRLAGSLAEGVSADMRLRYTGDEKAHILGVVGKIQGCLETLCKSMEA